MDVTESLITAVQQLRGLFADKGELRGFNDWDTFLGSIVLIENAIAYLQQPEESIKEE